MNVLIIEPDFVLAKTYKKAFETSGLKAIIAHQAQDAVRKIDDKKPDAVILELQLGGHSGVEFLNEFRSYEDWVDIPLYIYSSVPIEAFGQNSKILKSLSVKRYFYKSKTSLNQLIGAVTSDLAG